MVIKKFYRAGVIGTGFIGLESRDSHYRAYLDCPDTELVALCDIDIWHIPYPEHGEYKEYTRYEDMVENKLDVVSICTPVKTHAEIACYIAPFVKAIYLEKPIADTLEQADMIIETCRKNGTLLQVNHQRRFFKPKIRWSRGLLNNGVHAFDLARQIAGENWFTKFDVEYVDTDEYIFEIDIASDPAPHRLILKGVQQLVASLRYNIPTRCSGEDARRTLQEVLIYERNYRNTEQ